MGFVKATKKKLKLRLALIGPAGSGKTYSALRIARGLGSKIAVFDTEHGSASLYAGDVADFDTMIPDSFEPEAYIKAIAEAEEGGYDVLIIDSLSHAWSGKGGILEYVDRKAKRDEGRGAGNSFSAWRDATPRHNALVEAMLAAKVHLIITMRAKTEYVLEKDERGKTVPRKVGLQPVQRDGLEYEFTVVGDVNDEHELAISKTRASFLERAVIHRPDETLGEKLLGWLESGEEAPPPPPRPDGPRTPEQSQQITRKLDELATLQNVDKDIFVSAIVGHANRITVREADQVLKVLDAKLASARLKQTVEQGKARGLTAVQAVEAARKGGSEDPPQDAPATEPAGASGASPVQSPALTSTKPDDVVTMPAAPGPRKETRPRSTRAARAATEPTTLAGLGKEIARALDVLCTAPTRAQWKGTDDEYRKHLKAEFIPQGPKGAPPGFNELRQGLAGMRTRITTLGLADASPAGHEAASSDQPVGRQTNDDDSDVQAPLRA